MLACVSAAIARGVPGDCAPWRATVTPALQLNAIEVLMESADTQSSTPQTAPLLVAVQGR